MVFSPESLYIHIPFCLSKCSYCDFFSKPVSEIPDDYLEALCNEITWRLNNGMGSSQNIKTVYFGGGTPSLLSEKQIIKIAEVIPKNNLIEWTFEVNPDDVTEKLLKVLKSVGVTRISCGIQSVSDKVLSFCNRRAHKSQVMKALDLLQTFWDRDLSLDIISGLPFENETTFLEALEKVIRTKANHISLYSLTLEEETPMGKMVEIGEIDYDFDQAEKMWLSGKEYLEKNGFNQYEVSNFCKGGKISFHNMNYWNHTSYLGCGSGGTGTVHFKDGTAYRWTNTSDIDKYISFWKQKNMESVFNENEMPVESENLSKEIEEYEFFMMGLRTLQGVREEDFKKFFHEDFPLSFKKIFNRWQEKGFAEKIENRWTLGKKGILFLNKFLEELDI